MCVLYVICGGKEEGLATTQCPWVDNSIKEFLHGDS